MQQEVALEESPSVMRNGILGETVSPNPPEGHGLDSVEIDSVKGVGEGAKSTHMGS